MIKKITPLRPGYRIVEGFLWFPVTLEPVKPPRVPETRWLKRAKWLERFNTNTRRGARWQKWFWED